MLNYRRAFVTLATCLAIVLAISASSLGNRVASSESAIRADFSSIRFISLISTVTCPVTLSGSLHSRTLTKSAGSLIGYVTGVTVGVCEGGSVRAAAETLPWHLQYVVFNGSLPNITSITNAIQSMRFEIAGEAFGLPFPCRYTSNRGLILSREITRGKITSAIIGTETAASETVGCPSIAPTGTGSALTAAGAGFTSSLV
jgi:hypothetical protein